MDRQRNGGRFGASAPGNGRPTGSYRSQPSGSYKSRPGYAPGNRSGSRTSPGDGYTRRPAPRSPEPERARGTQQRERARRRRARRLRAAILLLIAFLAVAGILLSIRANRNKVVHQMPTIVRTDAFGAIVTEDS